MKAIRKQFEFREDAIQHIRNSGFVYVEFEGWTKKSGAKTYRAICEFWRGSWRITTYEVRS